LVLAFAGILHGLVLYAFTQSGETHACTKCTVLSLKLGNAMLEDVELGLAPVTAVLGGNAVAVCACLLALLRGELCARPLA